MAPPIDINGPKQPQVLFALFHLQSRYIGTESLPLPWAQNIQRPAPDGVIQSKVNILLQAAGFFLPFLCVFPSKTGILKNISKNSHFFLAYFIYVKYICYNSN